MAGMWIVGEDMPQESNCVTLDPIAKDKAGIPVANVHYDDHPNDVAMRAHAWHQGQAMYRAIGATKTMPTPPYPSTHNLGTCRMSDKAASSTNSARLTISRICLFPTAANSPQVVPRIRH